MPLFFPPLTSPPNSGSAASDAHCMLSEYLDKHPQRPARGQVGNGAAVTYRKQWTILAARVFNAIAVRAFLMWKVLGLQLEGEFWYF